ncbi:MAG: hypothetical protein ACFFD9_10695, partial [Candidatus Thorarchaeota archaeon]
MPMFELDFKIRHACTLGNISWDFPSIRILKWTNNGREVMELAGVASSDGVKIVRRISEAAEVMEKMSDGQKIHLITAACSCVVEEILKKGVGETSLLSISPTVFRKGWEYHRVIALRQDGINMLMDRLKERSFFPVILRKIPFNGFSGGSMT